MQKIYKQVERIRIISKKQELLPAFTNSFWEIMQLSSIHNINHFISQKKSIPLKIVTIIGVLFVILFEILIRTEVQIDLTPIFFKNIEVIFKIPAISLHLIFKLYLVKKRWTQILNVRTMYLYKDIISLRFSFF